MKSRIYISKGEIKISRSFKFDNDKLITQIKLKGTCDSMETYFEMLEICEEKKRDKMIALLETENYEALAELMLNCKRDNKLGIL